MLWHYDTCKCVLRCLVALALCYTDALMPGNADFECSVFACGDIQILRRRCSVILVLGRPGAVATSISDYCAELERRHSDHHHTLAGMVMVIDA